MIAPPAFRRARVLHDLGTAAVGLSLAAATATALACAGIPALPVAFPTTLVGCAWAALLRRPRSTARQWLISIPLAALNAGLACGLTFATEPLRWGGTHWGDPHDPVFGLVLGGFVGATLGVVVWAPALTVSFLVFGGPISRAVHLAQKGLAGEDRGEFEVGCISAAVALFALAFVATAQPLNPRDPIGLWGIYVCALLAVVTGVCAALFAHAREKHRRTFVRMAEAGALDGYRVHRIDECRVLMRVPLQRGAYRVAEVPEPICLLDESGEALRLILGPR